MLAAVLWAAIEDRHALWEYPGEVEGALSHEEYMAALDWRKAAHAALVTCVIDRLVQLFTRSQAGDELTALPLDEALHALEDEAVWAVGYEETGGLYVGATPLGQDVYQRLGQPNEQPPIERRAF